MSIVPLVNSLFLKNLLFLSVKYPDVIIFSHCKIISAPNFSDFLLLMSPDKAKSFSALLVVFPVMETLVLVTARESAMCDK